MILFCLKHPPIFTDACGFMARELGPTPSSCVWSLDLTSLISFGRHAGFNNGCSPMNSYWKIPSKQPRRSGESERANPFQPIPSAKKGVTRSRHSSPFASEVPCLPKSAVKLKFQSLSVCSLRHLLSSLTCFLLPIFCRLHPSSSSSPASFYFRDTRISLDHPRWQHHVSVCLGAH